MAHLLLVLALLVLADGRAHWADHCATCHANDGSGRTEFPGAIIPSDRITSLARQIQALYPAPNNPGTNSGLQNNLYIPRDPKADRDNYDFKVDWNRNNNHRMFVKFSTLRANVSDTLNWRSLVRRDCCSG